MMKSFAERLVQLNCAKNLMIYQQLMRRLKLEKSKKFSDLMGKTFPFKAVLTAITVKIFMLVITF